MNKAHFDDKDIMTDAMWEYIYSYYGNQFVTCKQSDWRTYFFHEDEPYKAEMDIVGNHIIVTKLDGKWHNYDRIDIKCMFTQCNDDADNDLYAETRTENDEIIFTYYHKEL